VTPLGRGGMSSVWVAERADGLIKRRVALKLPHVSWASPDLAQRMTRERDILASLEHPGIARLYDAGVAEDGRPYLALELVDGKPIDEYCALHDADIQTRVAIGLQAARAVAYAHSRMVVHRDLKPSNILVDAAGQVRLLDFGIGKLLEENPGLGPQATSSARARTPRTTHRPSRFAVKPSPRAPTSIHSASCCTSCWPVLFPIYRAHRATRR
jgi:serine/threonine-protein kinase